MGTIEITGINGKRSSLSSEAVESFGAGLRGDLVYPADESYDEVRQIWNAMIDRRPGLIARCAGTADVVKSVQFARENNLLVSIRGVGHNIAGNSLSDGALLIDLSLMRSVHVDPVVHRARVEPGATLGDFDHEAQAFGLATPLGINSTTGVSGLTLGGGFGWLTRKYGMTVDSLVSADVVTADGRLLRASADTNPDLFWAIRGGGGNFGIVTSFEFQLYPVGPEVLSGLIVYPQDQAGSLLREYREYVETLSDDTCVFAVLRDAPPLPFLAEEVHGKPVIIFAIFHAGSPDEGMAAIEPLRSKGQQYGEFIGVQPYTAWQKAFDPLLVSGARNYWKSHYFTELPDGCIDEMIKYAGNLPSPQCEMFVGLLGGQANRVPSDACAYSHRDVKFVLNVHGRWENQEDDERCIGWTRDLFKATAPFASGGVYVNFLTEEETSRIKDAYGSSYDRLSEVKRTYDPGNMFRINQNVKPGS